MSADMKSTAINAPCCICGKQFGHLEVRYYLSYGPFHIACAPSQLDANVQVIAAPQDRDVGAMKSALEFYRDNWRGNMIGDGETPGLSHCFQEPTDALMQDAGYRASDALSLRSASTPPSVAVIPDGVRNALEQAKDRLEAVQRHQDFGARLPSVQAALVQVRAALIPLSASPSPALNRTTGESLEAEEKEMFRLADRLGYVCTPEPPHPDSPHVQEQEETLIAIKDEAREEAAIELERIAATLTSNDDGPAAFSNNITATRYRRAAAHIRNTLKGQP